MLHEVRSTCCYCGVGCGVVIEAAGNRIIGVRGDPSHPANFGRLCTKGATLHLTARHETRALYPALRRGRREPRVRVGWDEALDYVAERYADIIRRHGRDAVAFYLSGQLLTEDYYVFNKLAKALIGTNNVDSNSRLCMSSAAAAYRATLGADAPPTCYEDIDYAQCILITGANSAVAHPVLFQRILDAKAQGPGRKLIVVDPRRTETAAAADLHLAIQPGTDVALCNALLHVMLWEGLCDMAFIRRHTDGFDALKTLVHEYTPEAAARVCGIPAADIVKAAQWFAGSSASLSFYCQGLNQSVHGTANNGALINLHLATGQIGKRGAGPFSLTGQANAMGGREVGALANLLPAHRDIANPAHRAETAQLWHIDDVSDRPGMTAIELFDALKRGAVKAVWIACTNPAHSMPHLASVQAALATAELVVLQEAYADTETAPYADVLLPAASWGEKNGTVTNSERRVSRVRAAVPPPGEARPDWEIAVDFALRLGRELPDARAARLFPYRDPESIFDEHRATTRGRDLDMTGMSYALLERDGPQQWPLPQGAPPRQRLYADGVFQTSSLRARFFAARHTAPAEETSVRYPFHLTTGRLRDQWHGMSRTGTVARLFNHCAEPLLSMNAADMRRNGLRDGDIVRVKSRRGAALVQVAAAAGLGPAQAFMPMHWGERSMQGVGVNALMSADVDPVSHQPELKHAAVQIEKTDLAETLVGMRRVRAGAQPGAPAVAAQLRPLLSAFEYGTLTLAGRDDEVVVFRGYASGPLSMAALREIDAALGLDESQGTMNFCDARRGVLKAARIEDGTLTAVRLYGETMAREWLREIMVEGASAHTVRRWLLAPISAPPRRASERGRVLCNCLDVAEADIRCALDAGMSFAQLQGRLGCGTACGACVPELTRLCTSVANWGMQACSE